MTDRTKNVLDIIIATTLSVVAPISLVFVICSQAFGCSVHNDYSSMFSDERYSTPVQVVGIEAASLGTTGADAVVDMLATWRGVDATVGDSLPDKMSSAYDELFDLPTAGLNAVFPGYKVNYHGYMSNSRYLGIIYRSLERGIPAPIKWMVKDGEGWSIDYALVTGLDFSRDMVTVTNIDGSVEELTVADFLARTTFDVYENRPLVFWLGLTFLVYQQNAVFEILG